MNKVYKLIWSTTLNCVIVVPESAKGGGGKKSGRRKLAAALVTSSVLSAPALAQTVLPTGGQVVSGQAAIITNGNAMTVRQSTDKMIANWQSFSIGKDASVTFVQPDASSVALNRVVGQAASQIFGALSANGQVFLVNPNGVLIGKGGSVQTGAFVASTLGLTDRDFLAGNYQFSGAGGTIVNRGAIKANVVALIAPVVVNQGSIQGNTALAAGTDALLDFDGDGLLSVQVRASTLATLVENKGLIQADGGTAILTAKGASDALKGVVNNTGTVQAQTIVNKQGRILLLGDMEHGEVDVAGTLDAGAAHGGDGGFIETSAAKVQVADSARITTGAAHGATGTWLIDPNDFTIAASGGNITGATLSTQLAGSNIAIATASQGTAGGNGDIFVNDATTWSSHVLTLRAERNITVNTAMNASATAGLALEYGQSAVAAGNTATYMVNAPVNLASTGSFSTKLGSDGATATYTIVTALGTATSSNDGTLQGIGGNLSGRYVLGANINAAGTSTWNSNAGFAPIGNDTSGTAITRYTATFDGLGHTVTGLVISRAATNYVGLFGYVETGAVVRNVTLSGGSVAGANSVGQLAGLVSGTVSDSHTTGTVSGAVNTGGLAGENFGTVTRSDSSGAVTGTSSVGGLVGIDHNSLTYSHATGSVTASAATSQAGGLVGYLNGGTISNSYATGQVSAVSNVGGLLGYQNGGTVSYNYASGNVSGSDANSQAGGLVGFLGGGGTISNSYATGQTSGSNNVGGLVGFLDVGTISNTYATGLVTSSAAGTVGGLVGQTNPGTTVSTSYWDTSTTGRSVGCGTYSAGTCTTTGKTTTQMKDPFTFIDGGWDFTTVWGKSQSGGNSGYMVLRAIDTTEYDDYVRLSNTNLSKTYGGANPALTTITLDGVGTGNVTLGWGSAITTGTTAGTYAYGSANVLSVTDTGVRSGYTEYGTGALTINKAALTVTASNASKTYDRLAYSGGNGVTYSGFVNSENSGVLSGTLGFAGTSQGAINAGSYTIIASGLTSQNYSFSYVNGALTVNKAAITGITGVTAANKTYDGTTTATLSTASAGFTGMVAGDSLSVSSSTGAFSDKTAGTGKTVNITGLALGGAVAGNYTLSSTTATTTADIAKASLSGITGITAANKTYDGTTAASLSTASAAFTGKVAGDSLSVGTATGAFTDKNAGPGKTVNITGLSVSGADSANYTLASTTAATTADIAKASLAGITGVTAANKTYDGTTAATLDTSSAAFTGMVAGDSLNVAAATGAFTNKNAGTGKTVSITGMSVGGTDAGNYTLASTTAATTADIAKASLAGITGVTAANKTYDGTTSATLDTSSAAFTGMVAGDSLNVAAATGAFTDKNAGTGKTVNITGMSVGGTDAGNYTLASTTAATTADIAKASLAGITGVTAANKTYDGTTSATLDTSSAAFTGMVAGDSLNVAAATGAFTNKNAGTGKTVSITGMSVGGTDAGNYTLASTTAATTADIAKASLAGITGVTAANKTYDGTTSATLDTSSAAFTGMVAGDSLNVAAATGAFTDKNAGTGKTVNITGMSVGGTDAGNYTLASTTAATTADIAKASLAGITGVTAANKTYDGTTSATLDTSSAAFTGMVAGDSLNVAAATGVFTNKNAGTGKTVNITGMSVGGTDAGNYTLASTTAATTADIAKASIAGITGVTAANKTYDGTTAATLDTTSAGFTGMVAGDSLNVAAATGAFTNKNAGTGKTVNITGMSVGGTDAGNYTLAATTAATTADIAKASIAGITGVTAANKTYDGTTSATLDTSSAAFTGMVAGDSLNVAAATGAFTDKNAATGKTVNITGMSVGGTDAGNYTLAATTAATTADIAKASIAGITGVTAANKTYDGTTSATLDTSSAAFTGMVAGDSLNVATSAGAFTDKNAGTGKTVNITGMSVGGTDAGNYTLAATTAATTADIAKASIAGITGVTAANKMYDSTTAATLDTTSAGFTGMVAGDSLNLAAATGAFTNKNAGTGKTVNITGMSVGGTDAGNYTLASTTAATTADIAKASIAGITGVTAANKTYDGTTAATLDTTSAAFTGMVAGDSLNVAAATGAFTNKNAGTGKTVNITGMSVGGTDAGNYTLAATTAVTTADIAKASIAGITGVTAANKTYDGTTAATLDTSSAAFTGMVAGDSLNVAAATGAFTNKNAGTGKTVNITGMSVGGADAGNYTLAAATAATTADIAKASIAGITGVTAANKTYDGTTSATLDTSSAAFAGMVAGDTLNVAAATGAFTNKNAGTGKTVNITGMSVGGADAGNYTLAATTAATTADIAKASIAGITGVTAANKTYDGTTSATLDTSSAAFTGVVAGDSLNVATAAGAFTDKNAGTGKTVNITGLSVSGADSANYTLATTTAATTADIAKASLAGITGITAENKTYDGTTAATLDTTSAGFTGMVAGDSLNVASATGAFTNKNAGTGKTVNITGMSVGGADAGNYTLAATTAATTADIAKASIAGITGVTAANKTYDGTTSATLDTSSAAFTGMVAGDSLNVATAAGAFTDKNAGTGKTVNITGLSVSGADSANYTLATTTAATTADIAKASLAGITGITAENKTYDGTTAATLDTTSAGFTGMVAGDSLNVASATGAFTNKNAGTGKTVNITGMSVGGADSGNYTLASTTTTTTADIAKASIAGITGVTAANKTYDSTTSATLDTSSAAFTGMVAGDSLNVATAAGAFTDKNAGTGKTVNITGLSVSGADSANYTLATTTAATTADIAKASLAGITGITAANKTYDGTTAATLDTTSAGFTGMVAGDSLNVAAATGAFTNKNAGTGKTVNITGMSVGGTDSGNYTLAATTTATTADIAKASIAGITGVTAANKTYDGTTSAILDTSGAAFTGMVAGDSLNVATSAGAFTDKNAGTGKTVNITGMSVGGTDAGNYTLAATTAATTADIAKASIAGITGVTAANKTYDGTTSATLDTSGAAFTGMVAGDRLNVATSAGVFTDKNAGTGKTVNITGMSVGGTDAGNYTLAGTTAATTADIAKASIAGITGVTAANKTYDGTTSATLDTSGAAFTGMVAGDTLNVATAAGAFTDKNAGTGKTVNITGMSVGGTDAGNYTLASTTAATTADIAKASIAGITGVTAANKTYDGTTAATLDTSSAAFTGMVAGDSLNVAAATGAFTNKNAGTDKTVNITGMSVGGADAGNYTLASSTAVTTADIAKASIAGITGVIAANKTYDGTTAATLDTSSAAFTGMMAGDSLNVATAVGKFADAIPGVNKRVFVTGLSIGGADAGNYVLTNPTLITSAYISNIAGPTSLGFPAIVTTDNIGRNGILATIPAMLSLGMGLINADDGKAISRFCSPRGGQNNDSQCPSEGTTL